MTSRMYNLIHLEIHIILKALFSFLLITVLRASSAQSPSIEWQYCLGGTDTDKGLSLQQISDGGYVVAGYASSNYGDVSGNQGEEDFWIVKLNSDGDLVWQKSLGGSSDDRARSVQQTSDGGYVVAGFAVSNDGDVSGNHGDRDYWVVKLNADGDLVWQKCLGGTENDNTLSIQQTSDGGYVAAGSSASNDGDVSGNHGDRDYWVVKLNADGAIWSGRSAWEDPQKIVQDLFSRPPMEVISLQVHRILTMEMYLAITGKEIIGSSS